MVDEKMKEQNKKYLIWGAVILILFLIINAQTSQTTYAVTGAGGWLTSIAKIVPWVIGLFLVEKVSGGGGLLGLSSFAWIVIGLAVVLILLRK